MKFNKKQNNFLNSTFIIQYWTCPLMPFRDKGSIGYKLYCGYK
jgi:hypothetical protein